MWPDPQLQIIAKVYILVHFPVMPVSTWGTIITQRQQWSILLVFIGSRKHWHRAMLDQSHTVYWQEADRLNTLGWLDAFLFISSKDCTRQSSYGKAWCTVVSAPLEVGHSSNLALVLQDHHTKQKTNGNKGPGKRREAAGTVSVAQSPLRVFFNPDTCKPFHHDLQWGKNRLGAGKPPEGLFSQQMMRNTLLFLAGQEFVVCCSQTYG